MMSGYRFVVVQGTGVTAPPSPPPTVEVGSPREVIRAQVRNAIRDVETSVQQATTYQEAIRAAEQRVDAAQQRMANARTPDQRGAAGQELGAAAAELALLRAQGVRSLGAHTVQPPAVPVDLIPSRAVDIAYGFFIMMAVMVVGWPLARAFGRRIERHGAAAGAVDSAVAGQLLRIEQAVEAMSIEIERISESQRFMAKLQGGTPAERSAIATGGERP